MCLESGLIHDLGMSIENCAHRITGPYIFQTSSERFAANRVHHYLLSTRTANDKGPHKTGMVMPVYTSKFQGQLVLVIQHTATTMVTTQQCIPS